VHARADWRRLIKLSRVLQAGHMLIDLVSQSETRIVSLIAHLSIRLGMPATYSAGAQAAGLQ